ncbi:MAG: DUF2358 domain-containing protein [Geitlerinemataceae cyanobacterium]
MTASETDRAAIEEIAAIVRADYGRFPKDQTYEIYDPEVYFKDPTSEFRGVERYKQTIAFIDRWFKNPQLDLHELRTMPIEPDDGVAPRYKLRTDWTLSWNTPLPWSPRVTISGWSELGIGFETSERGAIVSHVDYWHCSIWDVVHQHFPWKTAR